MTKSRLFFLVAAFAIFAIGLVMVFNTSAAGVLNRGVDQSTHHALIRQILYAFCGGIGAMLVWFVGYDNIVRSSGFLLKVGVILLILVFIPGIGMKLNGASRWIGLGGISFQPSEFVKYLIPLYYIHEVTKVEGPLVMRDFLLLIGKLSIPLGLILMEPDNGTAAMIVTSLMVLFVLSRVRLIYWALPLFAVILSGALAASQMPHVHDRIRIYLHPEMDLLGKGHQPYQAKIAAGSGKLTGRGLGKSLQKLDYLPLAHSDYIAAIYAEEFGFIGISILILLYMVMGYFGFYLAARSKSLSAFYTIALLTFMITFQAFLNLGVVSGLLPSKGINLPFFSQGGTSLLSNVMAVALLLSASRERDAHSPVRV